MQDREIPNAITRALKIHEFIKILRKDLRDCSIGEIAIIGECRELSACEVIRIIEDLKEKFDIKENKRFFEDICLYEMALKVGLNRGCKEAFKAARTTANDESNVKHKP